MEKKQQVIPDVVAGGGPRILTKLDVGRGFVGQCGCGTGEIFSEYMMIGGAVHRLITDQLGSVRLVVNATDGNIVQRIDYDEFGNATLFSGTWDFQPFGFAGRLC